MLYQIQGPADHDLERVHALVRLAVEPGGIAPRVRSVAGDCEASGGERPLYEKGQIGRGRLAVAIAKHNVAGARWRWHGVAVDEDGDAEFRARLGDEAGKRRMVRAVEMLKAELGLGCRNPQAVNLQPIADHTRNDAQPRGDAWRTGADG